MTTAAKKPAHKSHYRMRESLREMAERGTEHEAQVAQEKLRLIEVKYDFSPGEPVNEKDWFAEWPGVKTSADLHTVLEVDPAWMDAGNVVKWVFAARLKMPTKWVTRDQKLDLGVGVMAKDVRKLQPLAQRLYTHVVKVCEEYFGSRGRSSAGELERAPFIDGLTDGLSGEVRRAGAMTPGRSPHPPPKRRVSRKKPNSAQAPKSEKSVPSKNPPLRHTTVHPYDVGLEIGKRIRFNEDLPDLLEAVRTALQAPSAEGPDVASAA